MMSHFGDVVGMTMAHEATLCQERALAYASICSVDNYAHGLMDDTSARGRDREDGRGRM